MPLQKQLRQSQEYEGGGKKKKAWNSCSLPTDKDILIEASDREKAAGSKSGGSRVMS
jgi:hypothetical protein